MGILTKAAGNVIGLTQEARAYYSDSKAAQVGSNATELTSDQFQTSPNDPTLDPTAFDECDWELDEAQANENPTEEEKRQNVDQLLGSFANRHPKPDLTSTGQLPCPVVIPQRRPKHKDRGFVRAYAPVLDNCGVDQSTFLDFLNGFEKAIQMHPVFHAVNLGVLGAAITVDVVSGPSITGHMIAFAMHASIEASRRGFIQYQTNKYLDGINEHLFKPHGLYAMLMTYKPDSKKANETSKPSDSIDESVHYRQDGHSHAFSSSSGTTRREIDIPEVASLIYPDLEAMKEKDKENAMKKAGHFLRDYFDRRAQARFDAENPDSKLAVPRKEFASRYSDPTHPANSGGIVSLATGGAHTKLRGIARGDASPGASSERTSGRRPHLIGGMHKKVLSQNVLYLTIVNLPSESEMKEAETKFQALGDAEIFTDNV